MNLTDALNRFLVQLEADGRARNTRDQYARHLRAFTTWGGDRAVETITHEDIAAFLAAPETRATRRAVTMNALRTSIRMFSRYMHESGVIAANPARLVRRALCGTPPPKALADDDRARLLAAVAGHPRDRALFTLMLTSGIRVGSAVALDVTDLDLERGELTLRTTKGDHPESVFVPATTCEILRTYLAGRSEGPLFPGRGTERISTRHVCRRFHEWLKLAGITRSASPHSLRHSFATGLLRRTGDLALVQAAMRHRSIASTLVYARVDRERVRAAIG